MVFKKKYRQEPEITPDPLVISRDEMKDSAWSIPIVKIAGLLPSGSDGNGTMSTCFFNVSRVVDFQASPSRKLIYDMTDLRYDFGDHIGAFLWNLPALLDGVSIMVPATGSTPKARKLYFWLDQFLGRAPIQERGVQMEEKKIGVIIYYFGKIANPLDNLNLRKRLHKKCRCVYIQALCAIKHTD